MRGQDALRKLLLQACLIVLLLAAWAVPLWAGPVDPCQAARVAQGWYELRFRDARKPPVGEAKGTPAITADAARPIVVNERTIAYAFGMPGGGCIAIAADDDVAPVFYYSLRHRLTLPALPPAQAILEAFAEKIAELQEQPYRETGPAHPLWALLAGWADQDRPVDTLDAFPSAVGPLLTTSWDQGEPYNDLCPLYQGQRCPVGCVATAMAQIMRYWQHPPKGEGSYCYYWSRGEKNLCADFGSTTYDWANMPDRATSSSPQAVKDAVSTLCYHCGVSLNMKYGPDGSSARAESSALTRFFGYKYTRCVERSDHDETQWYEIIRSQIDKGQPVWYSIKTINTGSPHAVVLDGRDFPNLLHINMGWGGAKGQDGWYTIDYLQEDYAVVDIRPHLQPTIYVNAATGRDTWDGTAPVGRKGSRHGPKKTMMAGIYATGPHDTVLVADGVYTGAGNTDLDFTVPKPSLTRSIPRLITVRSANGPANCIIDCRGGGRAFYFHSGETELSMVDGLTIRNGNADYGGAIYCEDSSPTITNCIITGNTAGQLGGGLYGCNSTIQNCIITGNSAPWGGGLGACHGTIHNNTIVSNWADYRGGGLASCQGTIRNCIIWANMAGGDVQLYLSSAPTYSCIQGCTGGGEGNIADDPRFTDADSGDFRLLPYSPCIDAGDSYAWHLPDTDIAGMHRIMYGGKNLTVDMGAYEYYVNNVELGPPPDEATLTWSSLADRTYSIFYSDDLLTWHPANDSVLSAGDTTTSWIDDGSTTGVAPSLVTRRFYRILENP